MNDFIQTIENIDTELLLLINGANSDFFDTLMYGISNKFIWLPLYIIMLWFVWKYYRKNAFWVVITFVLIVAIADFISVHMFKNIFLRYRPCHNHDLLPLLHLVNNTCGGKYGFISSHACNTAAVATLSFLFFRKKNTALVIITILYSLLNCYSRIYLGVHYPSDVIAGAIVGVVISLPAILVVKKLYAGITILNINKSEPT